MKVKSESEVAQSRPTLIDPMDCSLPGSSIHGIFQARVLEWGAIAFSMPDISCSYSNLAHVIELCSFVFHICETFCFVIPFCQHYIGSLLFLLEKAMAPHSSTLDWKIPWTEEPGGLQSMGLLRVGHN